MTEAGTLIANASSGQEEAQRQHSCASGDTILLRIDTVWEVGERECDQT